MKWKKQKFYLIHLTNKQFSYKPMSVNTKPTSTKDKNKLSVKLVMAENILTQNSLEPVVTFKLVDDTKTLKTGKSQLTGNTWYWTQQTVEFTNFEPKNSLLQIIFKDQQTNQQIGVTYVHLSSLPKSCK